MGVVDLDPADFSNLAAPALIEFYAEWCGHCQAFKPAYEQLADALDSSKITVARIDASANGIHGLGGVKILGYPTLLLVNTDGTVESYPGARDPQAIYTWLSQELGTGDILAPSIDPFMTEIDQALDIGDPILLEEEAEDSVFADTEEVNGDMFQTVSSEYEFVSDF